MTPDQRERAATVAALISLPEPKAGDEVTVNGSVFKGEGTVLPSQESTGYSSEYIPVRMVTNEGMHLRRVEVRRDRLVLKARPDIG